TAKSIAKWVWKRFSYGDFSEIQAKRGAKGGKAKGHAYAAKREQAAQLKQSGLNNTQIAKQLSVSRMTVFRWFDGV
ncbi:MAG: helix-turn-helix domain-containing protein, partial [Niameybacter sp.]